MLPEDIDDLFRQKLDGHATPPGDDLWARLQLPADDKEPLDTLFREGLNAYAVPPRRELWERLEDEHLRPQLRKRWVAAWWRYSAAAVLLMLLAGGAGLWRGGYLRGASGNIAANKSGSSLGKDANGTKPTGTPQIKLPAASERDEQLVLAQPSRTGATPGAATLEKNKKYFSSQATAPPASTSNTPIATTTRPPRPATMPPVAGSHRSQGQQPDAAAAQLASTGVRKTPAGQHPGFSQVVPATTVAPATRDKAEAPTLALAPSPAKEADATPEIIEVDVRRGPEASRPAAQAAPVVAAATPSQAAPAADQPRRRLRLGGLLRQADHLVHGEAVSLAEATGLPESLTVQARLGGRTLSKTIRL